jgi:hypothetical protein
MTEHHDHRRPEHGHAVLQTCTDLRRADVAGIGITFAPTPGARHIEALGWEDRTYGALLTLGLSGCAKQEAAQSDDKLAGAGFAGFNQISRL